MANSMLHNLLNRFGLTQPLAKKRTMRTAARWQTSAEQLEDRALLSAVSLAEPTAAEIHGKSAKAASFPEIGGTWTLTASSTFGNLTDDLVITQNPPDSRKFTAVFNNGLASLTLKGKFNGETTATGKAVIELIGQKPVKSKFNVTFGSNFTTFSGQATAKNFPNVGLTGVRDLP